MLTLTRKVGEAIIIELEDGRTIRIIYKERRFNTIRLGFEAPREILVLREEVSKQQPEEGSSTDER